MKPNSSGNKGTNFSIYTKNLPNKKKLVRQAHKGGLFNVPSVSLGYKNVTRERGNHIFNAIYKSLLFNVQLSATRFVDVVACAIDYRCVRKYKV